MSTNKNLEFTNEEFQRMVQRTELIKQWLADYAINGIAPVCLVGIAKDGRSAVNFAGDTNPRKLAATLREIASNIEDNNPLKIVT